MMEELGDRWDDRPVRGAILAKEFNLVNLQPQDDMLQSILEEAIARHHTDEEIAARTLLMNFGALHTTSNVRNRRISILVLRFTM